MSVKVSPIFIKKRTERITSYESTNYKSMISLNKIFKKYTGRLRSFKAVYVINNLLNGKKLAHNKELYQKYGVNRSIFNSIGSQVFKNKSTDIPWLDRPNAREELLAHPDFQKLNKALQAQVLNFEENGFMILRNFFTNEEVEKSNQEVERLLTEKKAGFNYTGRKLMEAYKDSPFIEQTFFKNKQLLDLLSFVMGKPILPFHTIHFIEGSEQRAHSDSIHMTTEPAGYMTAAWVALEDTHEGNGPLFYYPGSHRLPYIMSTDYDSGNTKYMIGEHVYTNYEDKIEAVIAQHNLKKEHFFAKKGDVLVWHANLLHGGEGIKQAGTTRKSMVAHYFCEGVICYHEISQRPALLENHGH